MISFTLFILVVRGTGVNRVGSAPIIVGVEVWSRCFGSARLEGGALRRDIDDALQGWPYDPDANGVVAREIRARDGRSVLQVRQELGILQMEVEGRPDGERPNGFRTYLEYLRYRAAERSASPKRREQPWRLRAQHCQEVDREIAQYYHRRMAWLALQRYDQMLADADHTLALMDFVERHCDDAEFIASHDRFRGLVLFHRTQARASLSLERRKPEEAIDAVRDGTERIKKHEDYWQKRHDEELETPNQALLEQLRRIEEEIRKCFDVGLTMREQLDAAIAREDYEQAARLRDAIRARGKR